MTELDVTSAQSPFDVIRKVDDQGSEYWSARELMVHFGYSRWSDVRDGISRAKAAITNTLGETAAQDHIEADLNMIPIGNGARREVEDFRLTRYGAYMWAMNGDPRKPEIASAQSYFAIKTREAEISPAPAGDDLDLLYGILDRLREERNRITAVESRQDVAEAKISAIEGEYDEFTALAYAKLNDLPTNRSYLSRLGKEAAHLMRLDGKEPHKRQDATFGAINVYPASYLEQAAELDILEED